MLFHALEHSLILKKAVVCCKQVFTIGYHDGRAISDDTKIGTVNFFGDDPLHLFECAILSFIQVPLVGRFGNLFVAGPVNDSYPPDQYAFDYDNILKNNYLELYGNHYFEVMEQINANAETATCSLASGCLSIVWQIVLPVFSLLIRTMMFVVMLCLTIGTTPSG